MRKLILRNLQSPGDILMLTAAVRDLHASYPGRFQTDVRTSCPALWENNPHLTPLDEDDPEVTVLECGYPLVHRSNSCGMHFLNGFIEDLNRKLDLRIRLSAFRADLHLSPEEETAASPIKELTGVDCPYWLIAAGGKYDFTTKWWDSRRFQAVVDRLRDRAVFVQVGASGHFHPRLDGVIDRRGATGLRDLIRWMRHAEGVLCPVTFLMHLAAAVPSPSGRWDRPAVVVAGGREPPSWEAYPHHQFLHQVGQLECCAEGGCWRSRTLPLGDGDGKDEPSALCLDVVNGLPRCMDRITVSDVVRAIDGFLTGKLRRAWPAGAGNPVQPFVTKSVRDRMELPPARLASDPRDVEASRDPAG